MNNDNLLTIPQAAKRLGISQSCLYLWHHGKRKQEGTASVRDPNAKTRDVERKIPDLKFTRVGSSLRIAESELNAFIERNTH